MFLYLGAGFFMWKENASSLERKKYDIAGKYYLAEYCTWNSNVYYAKIPIKYVLDAVEAVNNESKMNAKRVPGVLDAGITWVGATYCGLGIARKLSTDEEGNPIIREETGTYIYQDTNNSTDDFERGVVPVMRRNGAKMPSWNHTL